MDGFSDLLDDLDTFVEPLWVTVRVTVGASALALVFAFVLGLGTGSRFLLVRGIARTIVELFRGTSLVVQLFWFVFAMPVVFGFQFDYAILTGILVLALNYGAYASEVVRGAIAAVPKGQIEASTAVNFSYWQRMRLVVVPQAWPEMIPPLSTLAVLLLKGSSLVSMIGVFDLTSHAQNLIKEPGSEPMYPFGLLLVVYFILAYLISSGMRLLERRAKRGVGKQVSRRRHQPAAVGGDL